MPDTRKGQNIRKGHEQEPLSQEGFFTNNSLLPALVQELARVRGGLVPIGIFTLLLGALNFLVVNQKVVLYLFYLPVIFAAWMLPKRHAVGIALLAAVMVIAYVLFIPKSILNSAPNKLLIWSEFFIWAGILIITAYLVSTLRQMTQEASQ